MLVCVQDSPDVVQVLNVDLQSGMASVFVEAESQAEALDKLPVLCQTIDGIGFKAEPHSSGGGSLHTPP